jgi:hypothetical protein
MLGSPERKYGHLEPRAFNNLEPLGNNGAEQFEIVQQFA